eukprot:1627462-Amphidinium_carterae.1
MNSCRHEVIVEITKLQTYSQSNFRANGKELELLHRVTTCDSESGYMELEPDHRHAMLVIKELGIDAKSCKGTLNQWSSDTLRD